MMAFLVLLGILAMVGVGATLTGRAIAGVANIRLLRRPTPETMAISALIGTGAWSLVFGWFSYAGLAAPQALLGWAVALAVLMIVLAKRRRLAWLALPSRPSVVLPILALFLLAATVYMLPVALGYCYSPFNDSSNYICIAQYLQRHGFGGVCLTDGSQPLHEFIRTFQDIGHRMGAMFLLAWLRAMLPRLNEFELFPAMIAWGAILNLGGVFVVCRWSFRLSRPYATLAAAITVAMANPLYFSAANGFLSQVYGTATLLAAIAVISRLSARSRWRFANAFLFALVSVTLLSMYSEIVPVLAIACLAYLLLNLWRALRTSRLARFLGFAGLTLLMILLLGNIECLRAIRNVRCMVQTNGCGWHVPFSRGAFWAFAMGALPYEAMPTEIRVHVAAFLATICLFIGLGRVARQRRLIPLLATLCTFGCLAAYCRLVAHDPWTGDVGHTWNLFKICKWAFPLVATVQGAGLYRLLKFEPRRRLVLALGCAACVAISGPFHWRLAKTAVASVQSEFRCERPFSALRQLRQRLDALGAKHVCIHGDGVWQRIFLLYAVYPRPFFSSAEPCPFFQKGDLPSQPADDTAMVLLGGLPFEKEAEHFPLGVSVVMLQRPFVLSAANPNDPDGKLEHWVDGEAFEWLGTQPVKLGLWSPRAGSAVLSFVALNGPSLPGTPRRRLRVASGQRAPREIEVGDASCGLETFCNPSHTAWVSMELPVAAGLNHVELGCLDRPSVMPLPNGDVRPLLANISRIKVELVPDRSPDKSPRAN
jgi:hypothetical protein